MLESRSMRRGPGWRTRVAGAVLLIAIAGACSSEGEPPADGSGGGAGSAGNSSAGKNGGPGGGTAGATTAAGSGGTAGTGFGGASARGGSAGTTGQAGKAGGSSAGAGGAGGAAGETSAGTGGSGGTGGPAGSGGAGGSGGVGTRGIAIDGRRLLVDGVPFHIRGVCWNPVPLGGTHPADLDYAGAVEEDAELMEAIGINVVRTYEPLTERGVLDTLQEHGIRVLNSVYVYGGDAASVVTARVNSVADHPAILGWVLGNEWNYNGLYVDLSHADALARLNEAATLIRAADTTHPIITVYGEVPTVATIDAMPQVDIWGINAYRGISFGDLFDVWAERSEKPMFLGEYGADAYNANTDAYDPASQAMAVRALTEEIAEHGSAFETNGVAVGGTIFEWSDEWWKDTSGSADEQDIGGIAPGGGPFPDSTFNEEWWGLVEVDRTPRAAYTALGEVFEALPEP